MLASFTFTWGRAIDAAHRAAIEKVIGRPIKLDDAGQVQSWEPYEADLRKLLPVLGDIEISVRHVDGSPRPLMDLFEKLDELSARVSALRPTDEVNYLNPRCNVHIGGVGLLMIDEVDAVEDLCTDELQDKLDRGWRILGVCVQPDQRRPDYVLGRTRRDNDG